MWEAQKKRKSRYSSVASQGNTSLSLPQQINTPISLSVSHSTFPLTHENHQNTWTTYTGAATHSQHISRHSTLVQLTTLELFLLLRLTDVHFPATSYTVAMPVGSNWNAHTTLLGLESVTKSIQRSLTSKRNEYNLLVKCTKHTLPMVVQTSCSQTHKSLFLSFSEFLNLLFLTKSGHV